jgi:hypothetical protein
MTVRLVCVASLLEIGFVVNELRVMQVADAGAGAEIHKARLAAKQYRIGGR